MVVYSFGFVLLCFFLPSQTDLTSKMALGPGLSPCPLFLLTHSLHTTHLHVTHAHTHTPLQESLKTIGSDWDLSLPTPSVISSWCVCVCVCAPGREPPKRCVSKCGITHKSERENVNTICF